MRAVFVNYIHPATPHVSGIRVSQFAEAFVRMGHQVILLTHSMNEFEENKPVHILADEIEKHDWSRPYHLACSPRFNEDLRTLRMGRLNLWSRKLIILWYFLRHNGIFHDWVQGTKPYWSVIADKFKPHITWGTFLYTDAWVVAQGISRVAKVPWIMDVKDSWDPFIPKLLRKIISRQFYDAAAMTTNSQYQANLSRHWFPQEPVVIYSGVPSFFLQKKPRAQEEGVFRITLVGGIYRQENLNGFMEGIHIWMRQLKTFFRPKIVFAYAGGDREKVEIAAKILHGLCSLELYGYLSLDKLFDLCSKSLVNVYLWWPKTFHHKLIELLCCQRPIIAFPGEHEETFKLAKEARVSFFVCKSREEIAHALNKLYLYSDAHFPKTDYNQVVLGKFSWDIQANLLHQVFSKVLSQPKRYH